MNSRLRSTQLALSGPSERNVMQARLRLSRVLACAVLIAVAAPFATVAHVAAWCNVGVSKWNGPSQTLYVYYTVPSNWNTSIGQSRNAWNGIDTLAYATPVYQSHTTTNFNLFYSDFSNIPWPDVPGGTVNNTTVAPHSTSNVRLNSDFNWNLVGDMDQDTREVDVRTVLTHELGHSSGLQHPSDCGPMNANEINAVMNVTWTRKWATNVDDWAGIQAIYP